MPSINDLLTEIYVFAAKDKFNGHNLHGKTLKVDDAKPRIHEVVMAAHADVIRRLCHWL